MHCQNINEINIFISKVMGLICISPQYLFHSWLVRWFIFILKVISCNIHIYIKINISPQYLVHSWLVRYGAGARVGFLGRALLNTFLNVFFLQYRKIGICIYDICHTGNIYDLAIETVSMAVKESYEMNFHVIGNSVKSKSWFPTDTLWCQT